MGLPPIPEHPRTPVMQPIPEHPHPSLNYPSPNLLRDTHSTDPSIVPNALLAMHQIAAKQAQERAYYSITPIAYDRHQSRYVPLGDPTTVSSTQHCLAAALALHTTPEIEICPMTYYSTIANDQASHNKQCTSGNTTYVPTPVQYDKPIPSFSPDELRR